MKDRKPSARKADAEMLRCAPHPRSASAGYPKTSDAAVARAGSARVGANATISSNEEDEKASPKKKRTKSEAQKAYWAEVRAGTRPDPRKKERPPLERPNPLICLSEEERSKLFVWLRECPYDDAVQSMLRDQGHTNITREQINDFFEFESEQHWEKRIGRAAQEANALVRIVERSPVKYSEGILAALGQEVFRQVANGNVDPDSVGKLTTLFLRARGDERSERMQDIKREKIRHEIDDLIDHALEELSQEVERHPAAREAFEALKRELTEENP